MAEHLLTEPDEGWTISGINGSGQARIHVGHHVTHNIYVDESRLSPAERQQAREDAILSSLEFSEMKTRRGAEEKLCENTFEWIFESEVTANEGYWHTTKPNLLSQWLIEEHGMFFIVGKAGSGKSTLFRYLAAHQHTQDALQLWAGDQNRCLTVASHFFWCSSGAEIESSQEGLWRSILYQVLDKNRPLISPTCSERLNTRSTTLAHLRVQPWTRGDLAHTLSQLTAQIDTHKLAVCLFVDGLDEFQGNECMLIDELKQLLDSPFIKICASSRPRNLFERAFGPKGYEWKLELHDLTQNDIRQLARQRLYENESFRRKVDTEERREQFVTTISDKADGVFLWVVLVVREIIREAQQDGSVEELEVWLDALPTDLLPSVGKKGLFQRIVERSDPRYKKYMARLLLVMANAGAQTKTLYWETFHFLREEEKDGSFASRECLQLDDKYRYPWDQSVNETEALQWKDGGVGPCCQDLFLHCYSQGSESHSNGAMCHIRQPLLIEDTRQQVRKWCPDFVDARDIFRPQFLHRSVAEFLRLPEVQRQMADFAGANFDATLTLCRLYFAHSRLAPGRRELGNVELNLLDFVADIDDTRKDLVRSILREFECIQEKKWSLISNSKQHTRVLHSRLWARNDCYYFLHVNRLMEQEDLNIDIGTQCHAWFLAFVVLKGMSWYTKEIWTETSTSQRQGIGTIIIAGLMCQTGHLARPKEQVDVVGSVLSSGVSPNTKYTWSQQDFVDGETRHVRRRLSLWEAYIEFLPDIWTKDEDAVSCAIDVIRLLLDVGHADTQCELPPGQSSLLSAIRPVPHPKSKWRHRQERLWEACAGQLYSTLSERGLLTSHERQEAVEGYFIKDIEIPAVPRPDQRTSSHPANSQPQQRTPNPSSGRSFFHRLIHPGDKARR